MNSRHFVSRIFAAISSMYYYYDGDSTEKKSEAAYRIENRPTA